MKIKQITLLFSCFCISVSTGCAKKEKQASSSVPEDTPAISESKEPETPVRSGYAVSSSCAYATEAAQKVLDAGGNAADAAVALAYTLAVAEPFGSGLGGGGFITLYDPSTDAYYAYDFSSEAPASGYEGYELVPGFVSGYEALLSDFGTMDYADLVQNAIDLCDGVTINSTFEARIADAGSYLTSGNPDYLRDDGELLQEGDVIVQPELKETLQRLVDEGPDSFYTGSLAQDIAAESYFTESDLAAYETHRSEALVSEWEGYTIASVPAPASGATMIQMLKLEEMTNIPSPSENNAEYLRLLNEITADVHADRLSNIYDQRFGGDDDYQRYTITDSYLEEAYANGITSYTDDSESQDTTAYTIIDSNGMIISATQTLSWAFGTCDKVMGFFMNASGSNFGSKGVNAYAPGKRPRTFISPTILRNDYEEYAIASPGGNTIVRVVSAVLTDIIVFGTDPQEAVDKRRVYFSDVNTITYEGGFDTPLQADVDSSEYSEILSTNHSDFGNVEFVGYSSESGYFATVDPRRNGKKAVSNP